MQVAHPHQRVMIDAVWPTAGAWREVVLLLGGSLLIALAAQLQILLPFSPVPVTGQTFAVLLLGALYGSRRGPATVVTYLTLGAIGLPVFAGGAAGEITADHRELATRRVETHLDVAALGVELARTETDDDVARRVPAVDADA